MITGILHKTNPENAVATATHHDVKELLKEEGLFFYIGESLDHARQFYGIDNAHAESGFEKAKSTLEKFHKLDLAPDFILVDMAFDEKGLCDFVLWMHSARWSSMIPVLFNISDCSFADIQRLEEINITDELVDIRERLQPEEAAAKSITKRRVFNKKTLTGKRIFDIMVSGLVLLFLSPLFLLIASLIKVSSKGPVLCKANYVGRHFNIFPMYRFRTPGCGDSRRARHANMFQRFLVKTYLNKLPLFINVFKGDMSVVGIRPIPLHEASSMTDNKNAERFNAPAGITGLLQISGKRKRKMNEEEKMWLDITYAREQGMVMDFQIIMETPIAMFRS